MKLYKISQDINDDYDTYSDAVVCAEDEGEAARIHPSSYTDVDEAGYFGFNAGTSDRKKFERNNDNGSWVNHISEVKVEYIGVARPGLEKGVICASFHAG